VKLKGRVALLITLFLSSLTVAVAQNQAAVEQLRSQLNDVQAKETELQARLKQIEEDLRPENIERYFALNGSTHPEELREERRRQLEGQRQNVQAQLDQLAASRTRLEAAIAAAEATAYRQSAYTGPANQPAAVNTAPAVRPKQNMRRARRQRARRAKRRG
jgi:chromosome segregation ATPase